MNVMISNIIGYFCILLIDLLAICFLKWGIEQPRINNIWFILCLFLSFFPILNAFAPLLILIFIVLYYKIEKENYFILKDNKINRFLFNNIFNNKNGK